MVSDGTSYFTCGLLVARPILAPSSMPSVKVNTPFNN